MKLPIVPPLAGLSEAFGGDDQPPLVAREFKNVRPFDSTNGIQRIAQRPGVTTYCPTQFDPTEPIRLIRAVTFDDRKVNYADASPTTKWSKVAPSSADPVNVRSNFKGDRYVLHDKASIVKLNSAGEIVEKITVPIADKDHACRALAVDASDNFYVAVSSGGDQTTAKLWKYEHQPDGTVAVAWEVTLNQYIEDMVVDPTTGFLYTCQNDPKNWKAWIVAYQYIQTASPGIAWTAWTGYPVNALAINDEGAVVAVHEPNANRGLDPNDLTLSAKTVDWTWEDLTGIGDRKQAHFDARKKGFIQKDIGAGGLPIYDTVVNDGDEVAVWRDLTGYNRDFKQTTLANRPLYRTKGFTGGPTLSFDGADDYMQSSGVPNTLEAMKETTKQVLPGWAYTQTTKGCGFLVWMVVKPTISATKQCLLGRANVANNVRVWANSNNAGVANSGTLWAQTPSATAFTTAPSYNNVNSAAIIVLVVDGANDGTQQTLLNINGVYSNRFSATSPGERNESVAPTFLGSEPAGVSPASFEIAAMGVLRSSTKTAVGATTEVIEEDGLVTSNTELNRLVGWLAHDFGLQHLLGGTHLYKTYPPSRSTGANYPSVAGLLQNQNAFMAKWAPGGQLRWAFPTAINQGAGTNDLTGAGIGYGVAVAGTNVYTLGPKFSAASNANERSIIKSWSDNGASASLRWTKEIDGGAEQTYHWPRLDVDKFKNVYIPLSLTGGSATLAASMQAYDDDPGGTLLFTYSTTGVYATNQAGRAVSTNPLVPEYEPDVVTRVPSFVVATTNNGTAANSTIWNVDCVAITFDTGPPRATHNIAVVNGNVVRFDNAGITTLTGGTAVFDPTSEFIGAVTAYGKLFLTDGKKYAYYDTKDGTVKTWTATSSGEIEPRCRLLALWRGRAVLARGPDDATNWHMSAIGDFFDWDRVPPVADTTQASDGNTSATGKPPYAITALIAITDDLMLIGTERGVFRMTGDPMVGGTIDLVTDIAGIAFGRAWAKDDEGNVYFFGSSGGVFRIPPSFSRVDRISQAYGAIRPGDIDQRILAVHLEQYRVEMLWNFQDDALHIYFVPWAGSDVASEHYVWCKRTQAWAVDTFGTSALAPTAVMVTEDSDPISRVMLVASGGYVRKWDITAKDDDGTPIEAAVTIGPVSPKSLDREVRYNALEINLAPEQDGCSFEAFVSDGPSIQGSAIANGELVPGRNPTIRRLGRGARFWLRLFSATSGERWAFDTGVIEAHAAGRRRVRS